MLTDDDLTTELRAAFHGATDDLRYAGRVPAPRNRVAVGVPLAASAAVVATLAVVWANAPETAEAPVATPPSESPLTGGYAPRIVHAKIRIAGFALAGTGPADDLYAKVGADVALPDGARPIDAPEGVKAWVGTDPRTGDHGVWVEAPTRNAGALFAVLSPTWTTQQLADLFHHGQPRTVPAT